MVAEHASGSQLEDVLNGQPSEETGEVSEVEEIEETEKEEVLTPEQQSRIQAEVDKRANTYREKREADTALIRSLTSQVKELKVEGNEKKLSKAMQLVLEGDEDEGIEPDKTEQRKKAFDEINVAIKDYNKKVAEVEEAAQFYGDMSEKLPQGIVKEFGLDDANLTIRATNGVKFLEETVSVYKHNQDFLMALEGFLPKGDELRTQLEEISEGLAEFETEKSKKLYLKDKLQGVKVVRKKPPVPSDGSGGSAQLEGDEALREGLKKEKMKMGR